LIPATRPRAAASSYPWCVDLPGEEEAAHRLRLERVRAGRRLDEVVLDRVARARHLRALQARDRPDDRELHLFRQAGGEARSGRSGMVASLRLHEDLVPVPVGEPDHLSSIDGQ